MRIFIKRLIDKETGVVVGISLITLFLGMLQTILYRLMAPAGFVYPWAHNFAQDYYYYLHLMRQGYDGHWRVTSLLTPEVFPGQFVSPFFPVLGHAARISRVSLSAMYTLARVIGGFGVIGGIWVVIRHVFPQSREKRLTAFLFACFGTFWWGWQGGPVVPDIVRQWTEFDPLFRWTYIPHHLWSKAFMIGVFAVLMRARRETIVRDSILAGVLTAVAGFASPVVLVTLVVTVSVWGTLRVIKGFGEKTGDMRTLIVFGSVIGIAISVALYHVWVEHSVFPWTTYASAEGAHGFAVDPWSYGVTLGPLFVLFLFSLPALWKKPHGIFAISWVASAWAGFILAGWVPMPIIRYLEGYQFIPMAIGAAEGTWMLTGLFRGHALRVRMVLTAALLGYFAVGLWAALSLHRQYIASNSANSQVYVPDSVMEGFGFLERSVPQDAVILAPADTGTMIPAFTGRRVVSGHAMMTYQPQKKQSDVLQWYGTGGKEPADLISEYRIGYIWSYSADIVPEGTVNRYGLKSVYDAGGVRIYKVTKTTIDENNENNTLIN